MLKLCFAECYTNNMNIVPNHVRAYDKWRQTFAIIWASNARNKIYQSIGIMHVLLVLMFAKNISTNIDKI